MKPHLCTECGVSAPELFYKNRKSVCKQCVSQRQRAYVKANPDYKSRNRTAAAKWQDDNMLQYRLLSARSRSKKSGLEFTITLDDIQQLWDSCSGNCYYTGLPMVQERNNVLDSVSLDRRDNTKGYIPGNVVLCRSVVNIMKSDLSEDDFAAVLRTLMPWATKNAALDGTTS